MVGIVAVSHSEEIAEGIKDLAKELVPREVPLLSIGGEDGRIGTDIDEIIDAVKKVHNERGVIIIGDVGSSLMNSKSALELLAMEGYDNVVLSSAPLVEGVMVAVIETNLCKDLEEIKEKIESKRLIELL